MRITNISTFSFYPGAGKNLLFCRVDTDEGTYGWGEAYVGQGKEAAVETYIKAMAPYLIGRSPFNIRHTGQVMFDDFAIRRSSIDFFCAWSAIEIALWDIVGKKANQPIYNLLGGPSREKVRVYANGWWFGANTIDETVKRAVAVKQMGFTAMKWDPLPGPWRTFVSQKDLAYAVDNVKAVREAVGPEVDLLVEVHRRLAPMHAITLARHIEEFNPFWFEEPCLADNIDLVVAAKREIRLPVVTGETLYTKADFVGVFEKRAADIINPDICAAGGILGMLEIAAMAEPYAVAVTPHNYNSTIVGLAATVHFSALVPNFLIAECFINLKPGCDEIAINPLRLKDGWVDLPSAPGLGVDIDVERLLKHPYRELPHKGIRQYWEEFPRQGETPNTGAPVSSQ